MKCTREKCKGQLLVSHTYTTAEEKYQRAECSECRAVYCLSTTVAPAEARGEGAKAKASRASKKTRCPY